MAGYKDGDVVDYPYLWSWQAKRGESEGRKNRPVCLALTLQRNDVTHLFLIAITSTRPAKDQTAIELPEIEARRAKLSGWKQGWVIVDEYNYDVLEESFYLDASKPPYGRFSEAFTARIKTALHKLLLNGKLGRIDRMD